MTSSAIREKKEFLHSLVLLMEQGGCSADALFLKEEMLVANKDKTSMDVARNEDEGVKLRVFDGEQFHARGISGWNKAALRAAAKELGKVKRRSTKVKLDIPDEPLDAEYHALGHQDPASVPVRKKIADIKALHKKVFSSSKKLVNLRVFYDEMRETKIFVSHHQRLSQEISGCNIIFVLFVQGEDGSLRYHYATHFDHGYERMKIPFAQIRKEVRFAERLATAKRIAPGKYLCLLTPSLAGLLAHESFGHGMEADTLYKGRGKALEYFGKRIASKEVSIADSPLIPGAHGFFFFDDEGFLATKTLMLNKGVVNHPLTDSYNAARLGVERSSNARAESFDKKIYARMTNTYFEPGSSSQEQLLKQIKDGLYLHTSSGGMEDPKGWGIQIQGITAERVKDGKLTGELYYEVGMTGHLETLLKHIIGVSKEFKISGTGRCGKGHHDWVRVAEGGPFLLVKEVILS